MSREVILSNVVKTGRAIVRNEVAKGNLADTLLTDMITAIDARYPVEIVWADMARAMGYSDKAAKIDGLKMPGTLATYRSLHRKAVEVANGDLDELKTLFSLGHADLKKMLAKGKTEPVQPVEVETENEAETASASGNEAVLENVLIPRWVAEIMNRHARMKVANPAYAAKFEADLVNFTQNWDGGK